MSVKFRQFQYNSCVFDDTAKNFRYTDRRPDYRIQSPVLSERTEQNCSQIFVNF